MPTFRAYIDENKRKILEFLAGEGGAFVPTWQIARYYKGEKETVAVRKALKELESEGKVKSQIFGLNEKHWQLISSPCQRSE